MTFRAAAAFGLLLGCTDAQPPLLGDCTGHCTPVVAGGGVVGDASCGLSSPSVTCQNCLVTSCCASDQACSGNVDCIALVSCLNGCAANDTICFNDCAAANEGGVTPYNSLASCVSNACNLACAQTD